MSGTQKAGIRVSIRPYQPASRAHPQLFGARHRGCYFPDRNWRRFRFSAGAAAVVEMATANGLSHKVTVTLTVGEPCGPPSKVRDCTLMGTNRGAAILQFQA